MQFFCFRMIKEEHFNRWKNMSTVMFEQTTENRCATFLFSNEYKTCCFARLKIKRDKKSDMAHLKNFERNNPSEK